MAKLIAWYLPQFHSIPENDRWWGEAFTEWTALKQWKPLFRNHTILRPHPDIGYYNLLDVDIRRKQAEIAKKYGIDGFCYYHYWFGNKQLLEKPLDKMLEDGQPDLPFCFCWVNQDWKATWYAHGKKDEMLQQQEYGGEEEWERHLQYLLPFFRHKNYILQDGKPFFIIYHSERVPALAERIAYWEKRLREEGFPGLHLVATLNYDLAPQALPKEVNAVADFYPGLLTNGYYFPAAKSPLRKILSHWSKTYFVPVRTFLLKILSVYKTGVRSLNNKKEPPIADTAGWLQRIISLPQAHTHHYRGLFIGFDASPRVKWHRAIYPLVTPPIFKEYLQKQIKQSPEFVFLNAWNEWGEGCVLEPDDRNGYAYLEAIRDVVNGG